MRAIACLQRKSPGLASFLPHIDGRGARTMPKYLLKCRYMPEALAGLQEEGGTGRRDSISNSLNAMGGRLEAMYFAMGEDDAIIIADVPDATTMAAASIAVGATGTICIQTVALLTPEDIDAAVKQKITYRPPGR
jgi:uncharacterized protein with GYD domain